MKDDRMRGMAVTVPLDDQQEGLVAILHLEPLENGIGAIFSDPMRMAFVGYDQTFADAIATASTLVAWPLDVDVRWWLESRITPDGTRPSLPVSLAGPSLGVAFYLGLTRVFDEDSDPLDSSLVVTGAIDTSGAVLQVGGYQSKLKAVQRHGLKLLAPMLDLGPPTNLPPDDRTAFLRAADEDILQQYSNLAAAADYASGITGGVKGYLRWFIRTYDRLPPYYPPEDHVRKVL